MSDLHRFGFELGALKAELLEMGRQAPLVMARALNRASTAGQTATVKAVVKDTGLQQKYVKRAIRIDKATRTTPTAAVEIQGSRIPLIAFSARGPEPSRGRGRGVSYRSPGSGRSRIPDAFIVSVPNAGPEGNWHKGVFARRGPSIRKSSGAWSRNLPIKQLRGPSIPHVFEKYLPTVFFPTASESLLRNLRHEIDFAKVKATGGSEFGAITDQQGVAAQF